MSSGNPDLQPGWQSETLDPDPEVKLREVLARIAVRLNELLSWRIAKPSSAEDILPREQ